MKKITITIICLFQLSLLQGQDTFIQLSDEEKAFITLYVDSLFNDFAEFSTLTPYDTVNLELKKQYLWLFEDRAEVINGFKASNNKISIQEYSNILSMQLTGAKKRISFYPNFKKVLLDSVGYDKLDDIYLVPILTKMVFNYTLDTNNKLIQEWKELNLRITANIYKNDSTATIANIAFEPSEIILEGCFQARPGDDCDDGDPNTGDDVYNDNCICTGKLKDCEGVPGGSAKPGTPCVNENNKSATNCVYLEDCFCKCNDGGIFVGASALGLLPFQNTESLYQHDFSFGAGLKLMLGLPQLKKLRFHFGVVYLPFASEFNGNYNESVKVDTIDQYGIKPNSININLNDLTESLSYNTIQIPIGVSYNILNSDKTELLIEVSAKPHFKIGSPTYELNSTSAEYKATYTNFGKTPLIIDGKEYNPNNQIVEQYLNAANLTDVQLDDASNVNSPFAVGAGIQLLQKLGGNNTKNNSYLGIHIHNNFFLQKPGWSEASGNISESGFSEYLTSRIFSTENKLDNAIGEYYSKDTKATFLEFGVSYIIKL